MGRPFQICRLFTSHAPAFPPCELRVPRVQVLIGELSKSVLVMNSKERPKRVSFTGSDGVPYYFLCKAEAKGDLRKVRPGAG